MWLKKVPFKRTLCGTCKRLFEYLLNAMTWPDKTMYPVASRNSTDFHNLMDVYLDAVFYPDCLQNPQILMQEGWHYELDKKDGELTYNGVVYNEMKGALSSPDALLNNAAMEKLFPDTTYNVESGEIQTLFLLFHSVSLLIFIVVFIIRQTAIFIYMGIWI